MNSWIWLIAGIVLANLELLIPSSFFLLFLGFGALIVSALTYLGFLGSWEYQVILFSVVAVLSWWLFGKKLALKAKIKGHGSGDLVGSSIKITQDLEPGANGSGELWGTVWRVKNVGDDSLSANEEGVVVGSEGITLFVKNRR